MPPIQFIGQNLHFIVCLLAALVMFAVCWLYLDAWLSKPHRRSLDALKWVGFLVISIGFLVQATVVEQLGLGGGAARNTAAVASDVLRLIGYVITALGLLLDPLQQRPHMVGIEQQLDDDQKAKPRRRAAASGWGGVVGQVSLGLALPVAAAAVAALYWKRATTGLERHLKPVALAFGLLAGSELVAAGSLLRATDNPALYEVVKAFGPTWLISQVLLLVAIGLLGRWVWFYLTQRFMSQLFMLFTTTILAIFAVTTVSFTFLLTNNVQQAAVGNLKTAAGVLDYALSAKKAETKSNAEVAAQTPAIAQAIVSGNHQVLAKTVGDIAVAKRLSSLVITSGSGQVLFRAEDPDRWGDSVSSDTLVRRALVGRSASSIESRQAVLAPQLYIRTTVPVRDAGGTIVGSASAGILIDNAFVDGIKQATGLDSAIYSGNVLSATTFKAADGSARQIGSRQTNAAVAETVLQQGRLFEGSLTVLGRSFLVVYAPIKDADNSTVGMLFIGQSQTAVQLLASRSIELTFLLASALLVLAVVPAYLFAKYLTRQLE